MPKLKQSRRLRKLKAHDKSTPQGPLKDQDKGRKPSGRDASRVETNQTASTIAVKYHRHEK